MIRLFLNRVEIHAPQEVLVQFAKQAQAQAPTGAVGVVQRHHDETGNVEYEIHTAEMNTSALLTVDALSAAWDKCCDHFEVPHLKGAEAFAGKVELLGRAEALAEESPVPDFFSK